MQTITTDKSRKAVKSSVRIKNGGDEGTLNQKVNNKVNAKCKKKKDLFKFTNDPYDVPVKWFENECVKYAYVLHYMNLLNHLT